MSCNLKDVHDAKFFGFLGIHFGAFSQLSCKMEGG
jgi:hypothetical protein